MFLEQETVDLRLLDVLYWQDENTECKDSVREVDALSLRLESDAIFDTGHQIVKMHANDIAFIPTGCSYIRKCNVDKMIAFHFKMDKISRNTEICVVRQCDYDVLYPMFRKALTEWTEKKPGYYYRAVSLLYGILGELCKQNEWNEKPMHPITVRAVGIMKQKFFSPGCSVSAIAQQLNVSEAYLRRMFQQELGQAPKQYLNTLRMNRARDLLNAGYDSVAAISEKVGFTDPKNFATAYKKHFGYPPSMQSYNRFEK